jgi:hypothetical protein
MFCERCGTKIEAGENFCPTCGNRVANPQQQVMQGMAYQQGARMQSLSGISSFAPKSINFVFIGLGIWMLICTLMPFIHVRLDNALAEYAYRYLGTVGDISDYKYNLYNIPGLVKLLAPEYQWLVVAVIILVLANIALIIAAAVLNKSNLYYAAGGLSAFLAVISLVYFFGVKYYVMKLNASIYDELGEFAKLIPGSGKMITGVNGVGLVFLIITLIAVAVLAFRKAPRCR